MIRLVIEVDDHYTWAECTKEAVAELLEPLGTVRVLVVKTDKPEQVSMEPSKPAPTAQSLHTVCPKCGARVISVPGPEGTPVLRDIRPRPVWPAPEGSVWVQLVDESWVRGELTGDKAEAHTVGFGLHQCDPSSPNQKEAINP